MNGQHACSQSACLHNVFSSYTRSMSTLVHFGPFHMKMMSAVCECGWFPGRASFYSNSTSIFAFLPAANTSLTMIPPLISVTESKSWLEDPYFTFSTTPEVMKVSRSQVSIRKTSWNLRKNKIQKTRYVFKSLKFVVYARQLPELNQFWH